MSFLSYQEILEAITNGRIRVAYYSVKDSQGKFVKLPEKQFVDLTFKPDENEYAPIIRDYFYESCKADSVYFHVGPYAKVEIINRQEERRYLIERSSDYIFNIQEANDFTIYAKEHIVVGTNEYIEVSENIGASIYSTVSKTDVGFSHISTIVDPKWQGILQIGIANLSKHPQRLNYLDRFCTVRFHRLDHTDPNHLTPEQALRFKEIRPHFARDWWTQESLYREMFPMGSIYMSSPGVLERLLSERNIEGIKKIFAGFGITSGIATILFLGARLANKLEDLDKIENLLDRNTTGLIELREDLVSLDKQVLQIGSDEITFSSDQPSNSISVYFNEPLSTPPTLFVEFDGFSREEVKYTISYSTTNLGNSSKYSNAGIKITYVGKLTSDQTLKGVVRWLIISRKG
jgi:deoxycytidine triphosphate deaminase